MREKAQAQHAPKSPSKSRRRLAPHQRKASAWIESLKKSLRPVCKSAIVRDACEDWFIADSKQGWARNWITNQLVNGFCHRTTLERYLPVMIEAGLVEVIEQGCHGLRKATVYRFILPSFSSTQSAESSSQGSSLRSEPHPSDDAIPHSPTGPNEGPAGLLEALDPEEQAVIEKLQEIQAEPAGIKSVVHQLRSQTNQPKAEVAQQILANIQTGVEYLATGPTWVNRPIAFLVQCAKRHSFAERVQGWLKTAQGWARVDAKRGRASKPADERKRKDRMKVGQDWAPWQHLLEAKIPPMTSREAFLRTFPNAQALVRERLRDFEAKLPLHSKRLVDSAVATSLAEHLERFGMTADDRFREIVWAESVAMYAWLEALPGAHEEDQTLPQAS